MGLTLLKGGKDYTGSVYNYVSGCVTDTRLMGVLGLHLHWTFSSDMEEGLQHVHQYFYYDIEELGLDSIKVLDSDDETAALLAEKSSFGGLGAKMIPVNEREARHLVCTFVNETKRKRQPLPENLPLLSYILDHPLQLSSSEISELNNKMCTDIHTDCGVINYYLMRVFGKDEEGAALLRKEGVPESAFEDVSLPDHATFLQNHIDCFPEADGRSTFLAESLTESRDEYHICVSEIELEGKKVVSAKKISQMRISPSEASLRLTTDEYVCVFEIETEDMDRFDSLYGAFAVGTTRTRHETGDMYMAFKPDNSHVENNSFRLSDDLFSITYITDYGQLILGAYTPLTCAVAEARLMQFFKSDLRPTGHHHFAQSIIYEFALSGFIDFDEYMMSVTVD